MVCFPLTTEEVQAACGSPGAPWPGRRPARFGHRAGRRCGSAVRRRCRPGRDRHHQDGPDPRGRRRGAGGLGAARRAQPRPHPGRRRLGLHFAPDPSSQQSCSVGGNVANNSGGPHCLALRRDQRPRPRPSRSCCPTARWPCSADSTPTRRLRPARRLRGQRGHDGHRHRDRRAPHADAAGRRTLLIDFTIHRRRRRRPSAASSPPASCPPRSR